MHLYDTSKKRLKMFDGRAKRLKGEKAPHSLSTLKSSNGEAIETGVAMKTQKRETLNQKR